MASKKKNTDFPDIDQLKAELDRVRYRKRYRRTFRNTVYMLVVVVAVAVLVATLWMPVLRIYGSSMTPTLVDGNIVISVKESELKHGDVIAFYYNNKILVKRVIADSGQWVDMAEDGTVYVDNNALYEPYIQEKAFGDCDLALPYQVPESRVFVMGDHRSVSVDSRHSAVGCIAEEQIVGKLVFCIWPLDDFGPIR